MSLICVMCGKVIVQSLTPNHYGVCSRCNANELTPEQKDQIKKGIKGGDRYDN